MPPEFGWHRSVYSPVMASLKTPLPVDEFVAPLPLVAVAVLTLNDHLLKGSGWLPGWLTGKLSDFTGLFFFPLFASALLGVALRRPTTPRRLMVTCGLTAVGFTLLQLSTAFSELYVALHHALVPGVRFVVTRDPSDLAALPAVLLAYVYGVRRSGRARRNRPPDERSEEPAAG